MSLTGFLYVLGFLFARMARDDLADVPERGGAFGRVQPLVRRMVIDLRGVRAAVHARHIAAPAVFILQNAVSAAVRADLQFDILEIHVVTSPVFVRARRAPSFS